MNSSTVAFVAVHSTMLLAVAILHDGTHWRGCVFYSVLAAQFALIGVWLGLGDRPWFQRWVTGLLFGSVLAVVAITRPAFNPWELLLASTRLIALGVVFGLIRRNRELVVRCTDSPTNVRLFQFSLVHLFELVFGSAMFFAAMRLLESYGGRPYDLLLVVTMVMLGLAASLVSLLASAAALGHSDLTTIATSVFAILIVASGLAWFAYIQTDSTGTAAQWFVVPVLEAIVVATSLIAIRLRGYQLVGKR